MKLMNEASTTFSYSVFYEQDAEGGYVVFVPSLPGYHTQGETLEETERNVKRGHCRLSGELDSTARCLTVRLLRILKAMELLTPDEIVRLSPPERLALIAQLWDSLEHEQLPFTGAQQAELERRLTSLDQDRRNGVTWSALKAELEQRCP